MSCEDWTSNGAEQSPAWSGFLIQTQEISGLQRLEQSTLGGGEDEVTAFWIVPALLNYIHRYLP